MPFCQNCGTELKSLEQCDNCGEYVSSTSTVHPTKYNGGTLEQVGIHPLVALTVAAVDTMLFGDTIMTGGAGWVISIPVGAVLAIGTALVQNKNYGDNVGTSIGKGLIVGLLTAIPTPLPSLITLGSGAAGFLSMRINKK